MASEFSPYLTRIEAADYIAAHSPFHMTKAILAHQAAQQRGPKFMIWRGSGLTRRGGRGHKALYLPADLDAWIAYQLNPTCGGDPNVGSPDRSPSIDQPSAA